MDYIEDVVTILSKLNLDDIEQTISESYIKKGAGRPARKPIGIFKALMSNSLEKYPATENSTVDCGTMKTYE